METTFVAKEWLIDDPIATLTKIRVQLEDEQFAGSYVVLFRKRLAITNVYASNKLERTLPAAISEHDTYMLLEASYDASADDEDAAPGADWNAEGEEDPTARNGAKKTAVQLLQHLRALKFLMQQVDMPLSAEIILKAHEVLMAGALDDDGTSIKNGVLRDHPCHAGTHVYPEGNPAALLASLRRIIDEYNVSARASPSLVLPATRLFYDVITLHPFQNGNGRMCRLLFAFGIMQSGVPFPVALTTGHSNARKHYMKAIMLARRGDMRELATMALMSVEYTVANFLENLRLVA